MAEMDPGHPDELRELLGNWIAQANDPIGTLPLGTTAVELAVKNFIDCWRKPVRSAIDAVEEALDNAKKAVQSGGTEQAMTEIEIALQGIGDSLRNELGIYEWNREAD